MTKTSSAAAAPVYTCQVSVNRSVLSSLLDPSRSRPAAAPSLVGAIDQGTSSTRFLLVTSGGEMLSSAQVEFEQQVMFCWPSRQSI